MKLADIKKLQTKKYRRQFGYVFLEGERFVREAESSPFTDCEVITSKTETRSRFKTQYITKEQYSKITDVKEPQGIGVLIALNEFSGINTTAKAVYLDDVQDPGNLGTIIRTLAWFGGYTLYLSAGSADPYNSKVLRSAAGGHFYVPIIENADFFETRYLHEDCYILDLNGKNISQMKASVSFLLILGNEANGVSGSILSLSDIERFRIMGTTNIESLNVGTAASIALYQLNK
jgi:TrmH family RNA methyltransferase